jgi:hypothetical protein
MAVDLSNTEIVKVTCDEVEEFCERFHYSHTKGSALWRWGLSSNGILIGVVAYNLPTRTTCESLFGKAGRFHVWHMGRLAMADDAPRNSESRLIAGSLREIQTGYQDVWGVVTYAASDVGHIGYVYQATNAIYTGKSTVHNYYTDSSGNRRSDYLSGFVSKARAESMGWTWHRGAYKHRYVYILGNKTERKARLKLFALPTLPYPKGDTRQYRLAA